MPLRWAKSFGVASYLRRGCRMARMPSQFYTKHTEPIQTARYEMDSFAAWPEAACFAASLV